jgi:phenylalanyl-tRNA synthetase alpha chain
MKANETQSHEIIIESKEEEHLREDLLTKSDADSMRLKHFLDLPDLSRTPGSPLEEVVSRTLQVKSLEGFDIIKIPEIISTEILFDLFNMPPGHPARSRSDTYYVDDRHVLRTHDTVFWYYYLNHPLIKEKIKRHEPVGALCFGKVYRKDEIDRSHMNVFHQIGGLYLVPDQEKQVTPDDLKEVLSEIARAIFGEVRFRFYDHNFPYTDPSFEMEAEIGGEWIEMLGSGMPRKSVLANFGLEGYHGWAFGFGLERLAIASMALPDIRLLWSDDERVKRQLKLGHKFKQVSKFPPVTRDISFVVARNFVANDYFDLIRDLGGSLVEEVKLIDKYEDDKKFGSGKLSYTFRIIYRSIERTLTNAEVNMLHAELEEKTEDDFGAVIRRV